jgi:Carboxypeptidase regulatory-like domain
MTYYYLVLASLGLIACGASSPSSTGGGGSSNADSMGGMAGSSSTVTAGAVGNAGSSSVGGTTGASGAAGFGGVSGSTTGTGGGAGEGETGGAAGESGRGGVAGESETGGAAGESDSGGAAGESDSGGAAGGNNCTLNSSGCLTVTSSTHPDPSLIYNDGFTQAIFAWNRPFPTVQGYFQRLDTSPHNTPTPATGTYLATLTATYSRSQFVSGFNYFHIVPVDDLSAVGSTETVFAVQVNTAAPVVTSSSHPSQTVWNTNDNAYLSWTLPTADANNQAVYYVLDHYGTTVPTSTAKSLPVSQKQLLLTNLAPGIWGFHIVAMDQGGYFTTVAGNYRVRIGSDPGTGGVLGTVVDGTAAKVSGATVTINRELLVPGIPDQQTSGNGSYNFGSVPVGTWEVQVSKVGFSTQTRSVVITPSSTASLNFTLTP